MEDSVDAIFERVKRSPEIADKLRQVVAGQWPVRFSGVAECAQPFLVAAIVRATGRNQGRAWVLCENERAQERFQWELGCWLADVVSFPHLEIAAVEGAIPDPESTAERLGVLQRLADARTGAVVVVTESSLADAVPSPASLQAATLRIRRGVRVDREALIRQLVDAGYENVPQVADRGQFAVRGGVMDLYSWQQGLATRLEWFDDEVDSIREFEVDQQTSVRSVDEIVLMPRVPTGKQVELSAYIDHSDLTFATDGITCETNIVITATSEPDDPSHGTSEEIFYALHIGDTPYLLRNTATMEAAAERTKEQLHSWLDADYLLVILYDKPSEVTSLQQLIFDSIKKEYKPVFLRSGSFEGFDFPRGKLAVVTSAAVLGNIAPRRTGAGSSLSVRRTVSAQRTQLDFTEFAEGDAVVHLEHGLARFLGIERRRTVNNDLENTSDSSEEVMILEFAEGAKLYVPLEQAFLVSRYVGLGKRGVALSKLGDGKWSSTKKAAAKSVYDYASQLLKVQAQRELHPGFVFGPDGTWQREFEETFPYRETADQIRAINDTKADMESGLPMDRLICGDVGFGKTEVAIRAAFKAAAGGKQVAVLVPTTVLAQQHYENFSARMAKFPVTVELMSRFRSRAEQLKVAEGLRDGSVDLVIGTHRLISQDIAFKDLGLLVVDEEQRFGVRHKERIKERFPHVDVVTLSATPIPRTLYMALTGARALSTLETPPPNRYPVETVICAYDERVIRAAIERELDRQGQVYFLHNRIEDIERVCARVRHLCPRARVDLGHGQMDEGQLEDVMHRFVSGQTDVLVATTIIESGLDIPNANTIIIDRADRFGLADLYQLRGRVGRGNHKAYAYLMLPRDLLTVGEARRRINAIRQYSALGAGFKIALRDLEIRGAGNILGVAQSGHLTAIGFDLYCQLLRQAVGKLKGEKARPRVDTTLRLDFVATSELEYLRRHHERETPERAPGSAAAAGAADSADEAVWPAFLPSSYIEEPRLRIQAYRQLAEVTREDDVAKLHASWRDRFGRLPEAVENLLRYTRFRLLAATRKLQQVEVQGRKLMLTRGADLVLVGGRFPRLTSNDPVSKMRELFDLVGTL